MLRAWQPDCLPMSLLYNLGMKNVDRENSIDAVIAAYAKDIDKAALLENLRLTPEERSQKFLRAMKLVFQLRRNAIDG